MAAISQASEGGYTHSSISLKTTMLKELIFNVVTILNMLVDIRRVNNIPPTSSVVELVYTVIAI